ncbi:TIGR02680 family protein [Glycomyces arizonensis]|uniref:TIGR02680 family protein n=1 Tax=Glycomyces arizonensis TaxID=256035 RepID=UPI00041C2EC3|nr:TIGR02680 family protein [Glycomyces arizonensis]
MTEPRAARWVPTRAGILNLWRYYDETFAFHNGRLLLRGPNGSGKSKALELLLPYLLDADTRAHRLSTFGTGSHRNMHWNLMGEGATGATRVGYLWLEFTRGDSGETFTCGVRLSASKHNTKVNQDYFTTTARIGVDLSLVNDARQPLRTAELKTALAGTGGVLDRDDYRERIRKTLYPGLSEQRYEALIRAMLQLRTPKLSELLDPKTLSTMLSQALPPMDETQLEGIADGFERLDRHRARLERLAAQREAATDLDASQRRLARILLRTAADAATGAEAARDRAGSTAAELQRGVDECAKAQAEAEGRKEAARRESRTVAAGREQLAGDPRFDQGRRLDSEKGKLRDYEKLLTDAVKRASKAESNAARLAGEADTAARNAQERAETARERRETAAGLAESTGLLAVFSTAAAEAPGEETALLRSAIRDRREALKEVGEAARTLDAAERRRVDAERRREAQRGRYEDQEAAVARARETLDRATEDWTAAVERWSAEATEMRLGEAETERILAAAEEPSSAAPVLQRAYSARDETLSAASAAAGEELKRAESALREASQYLAALEGRKQVEPRPPRTRTADRTGRPGAPLWQLVDFAAEPDPALEAALEASGLLDAWVMPDGAVELDAEDTVLSAHADPVDRPLAAVLRPEPEGPVPEATVAALLDRIGFAPTASAAPGSAAVGADGTWRLAGLAGRWSKPAAEFIGASSRRRHRERLIAEARERVTECERAAAEAAAAAEELKARRDRLREEHGSFPLWKGIEAALQALDRAEERLGILAEQVGDAETELHEAEGAATRARLDLERLADSHRLPRTTVELDRRSRLLDDFDTAVNQWSQARLDHERAETTAGDLAVRAEEARETAAEEREAQAEAEARVEEQRAVVETLDQTVGADLRELRAERDACDERLEQLERQQNEAEEDLRRLAAREAGLERESATARGELEAATTTRDRAFTALRELLGGQVLSDARIDYRYERGENVKATLEAARRVAAILEKTRSGDRAVARARNTLRDKYHEHRGHLADYAELAFEGDEGGELLVAQIGGERIGPRTLADRLAFEHDRARAELTDEEQQLFGEILTGQIRASLARRIREADELVAGMNTRLQRVRTSSGMSVRLRWRPHENLDARSKAARELLLKRPEKLSGDERDVLRDFLAQRVDALRESEDPRPWSEQLKDVFDYTAWHEFQVEFDKGEGWRQLTRRQHSNLSGGEKAVSLHLPLFAALASHYETSPTSPRLLLLDEVLVGVDRANRGQVFELVRSLGLDAVLTSEHEWGDYAELDGIAIHQVLTPAAGDDTVTTVRYVWDGTARVQEDVQEPQT